MTDTATDTHPTPGVVLPSQAAAILKISQSWLAKDRLKAVPEVPFVKLGRSVRYALPVLRRIAGGL